MAFRCYRVVRSLPPTRLDFLSNEAKGLTPRGPEKTLPELNSGLSVFDSAARAQDAARRLPFARAICVLELPDGGAISVRKTLGPGHYTVWGDPDALLASVRGVV